MDTNHFKIGQKAFLMQREPILKNETQPKEVYVVYVDRKYVDISYMPNGECAVSFKRTDYGTDNACPYLEENKDWGNRSYLFKTRKAFEEYQEYQALQQWLFHFEFKNGNYTLEQLRKIKRILTL